MNIPVELARTVASACELELAVIVGYDGNRLEVASYGGNPMAKDMAADWADRIPEALDFDASTREMHEDFRASPAAQAKHKLDLAFRALQEIAEQVPVATSFDGTPVVSLQECWKLQKVARVALERLKG